MSKIPESDVREFIDACQLLDTTTADILAKLTGDRRTRRNLFRDQKTIKALVHLMGAMRGHFDVTETLALAYLALPEGDKESTDD